MRVYPKKAKKAYVPPFLNDGSTNPAHKYSDKVNPANFMRKEEFAKSKYSTMSKSDFEDERIQDAINSISF